MNTRGHQGASEHLSKTQFIYIANHQIAAAKVDCSLLKYNSECQCEFACSECHDICRPYCLLAGSSCARKLTLPVTPSSLHAWQVALLVQPELEL